MKKLFELLIGTLRYVGILERTCGKTVYYKDNYHGTISTTSVYKDGDNYVIYKYDVFCFPKMGILRPNGDIFGFYSSSRWTPRTGWTEDDFGGKIKLTVNDLL